MKGRERNYLVIRLQKHKKNPLCKRIIVARIGTKSSACIDCLGSLGMNSNMTLLKLDLKKLEHYLVLKHVKISPKVLHVFLDLRGLYFSKTKIKPL